MHSFLNKLSQIPSIQEVLLLSPHGELLFCNNKNGTEDGDISSWNKIINDLNSPLHAEFYFKKGVYSLHHTGVGYVVVGMKGNGSLQKIKNACTILQEKLSDPVLCKKILLKMLREVDDELKPQIVQMLLPFADEEIAGALALLLDKEAELGPKIKSELLVNICQVLGQCASNTAWLALKSLLQKHYSNRISLANEVRYAAQVALTRIDHDVPDKPKPPKPVALPLKKPGKISTPETKGHAETSSPASASTDMQNLAMMPNGRKIEELLQQNKKKEAVALIVEQVEICAGNNQFDLAEKLRERLIQIDSTLLQEIIRAAEIIQERKNAAISDELLDTWGTLINTLSLEAFSSLYHLMDHKHYDNGQILARQGEFLSTLYFVNSGRIQLYSENHGQEYVLKIVNAGEILGAETFFDISIWTISARSMGADLSLLTWNQLLKLKESHPALQTKLMDFCSFFKLPKTVFTKQGSTRREFERVKVPGKVTVALQRKSGEETIFGAKGDLLDISRGGLAFSLRFSRKKNAIALLGESLRVSVRTAFSPFTVERKGVVKAVQCHDFVGNDYSIHMEFEKSLSNAEVQQVVGLRH